MKNTMKVEVSEEEFKSSDRDDQLWLLMKANGGLDNRVYRLEKKRKVDTAVAGGGGIFGGFLAFFMSKLWGS